jgi:WD40 repeat protein
MLRLPLTLSEVRTLGFSPDNRYLLAVGRKPLHGGLLRSSPVVLWDLSDPAATPGLRIDDGLDPVAGFWLPDGRALGVDDRGSWQTAAVNGAEVIQRGKPDANGRFLPAAVSPDGTRLVLLSRNRVACERLPGAAGGTWEATLESRDEAIAAAFSPGGGLLAVARVGLTGFASVGLHDAVTGVRVRDLARWGRAIRRMAWSPDGRFLAADSETEFRVVQLDTEATVAIAEGLAWWVPTHAFHPGGSFLATAHVDRLVRLWDVAGWSAASDATLTADRTFDWGVGDIQALAFSPDGSLGAVAGARGEVVVWDVDT